MIFLFDDNVRTSPAQYSGISILVGAPFYWTKNSVTIIKSGFSLVSLTNKDVSVV